MLYLIPTPLGENSDLSLTIPSGMGKIINNLTGLIAEDAKNARAFLKIFNLTKKIQDYKILILDEHTKLDRIKELIQGIKPEEDWGLISDAGAPSVADPGHQLIHFAHKKGIVVKPLVGPSSILLALMASGLNGQNFVFHGYLPKDQRDRIRSLKYLEKDSSFRSQTQIFMEAPYRNQHLLEDILNNLNPRTELCLATDLTLPTEEVRTKHVEEWKAGKIPDLFKKPTIFLLYADKK